VKSKNKIVYVFALEKDLGDEIKIKSNLVRRRLMQTSRGPTQTKDENKFIEFPEVDKGEYFDLEVAKEKLVSYQKELIEMVKLC
jgi:predicted NUDIX family NTP pyrophosphohydrolase